MDVESPPLTPTGQILRFLKQSRSESGPQAVALGRQLLEAEDPMLRVAGAAVLSDHGALDQDTLLSIASDVEPAVAVNVIGWLNDTGESALAHNLATMIRERGIDTSDLIDLVLSETLNGAGSRAALEIINDSAPAEESAALYSLVSTNSAQEYAVRMKAAVLMADTMDFSSYRDQIAEMKENASAEEALWLEGISRLADRLEGPLAVMESAPTLSASDVDEMVAREYPMTLEDLAQRIEYVVGSEKAHIEAGTAARLREHVEAFEARPWTEEQQSSLQRLSSLAEQVAAMELENAAPANLPAPPPGAE